jgi:hypothetical protein
MKKIIPWLLTLASFGIAAAVFVYLNGVNTSKDSEIKLLNEKYALLSSESESKLKDMSDRLKDAEKQVSISFKLLIYPNQLWP